MYKDYMTPINIFLTNTIASTEKYRETNSLHLQIDLVVSLIHVAERMRY